MPRLFPSVLNITPEVYVKSYRRFFWFMFPNHSFRRFLAAAMAVTFLVSGFVSPMLLHPSSASPPPNVIPQVGLDVNNPTPQSFINSLASQKMTWIRQYGPNGNTPMIHSAGINDLMSLNANLFSYNPSNFGWQTPVYSDVRQLTPQQWYTYVYTAATTMPWITEWEFMNEPNLAGGSTGTTPWTPQQYFEYLIPTYQALKAANPSNTLMGPTLAWPWPIDSNGVTSGIVNWLQQLWALSDPTTGLTASVMLSEVSMHIYTCCWGGAEMPNSLIGTVTEGQLIQAGLAQSYAVTGKPMVIDEWGWPTASITSGGVTTTSSPANQATYYQQFMSLMESTPNIGGVFAYDWSDYGGAAGGMGVFDSNLNPQPAWPVYQQYFPITSSTSSTTTTTSTTTTPTATTTTTSSSSTSTTSTSTQSGGTAVITVQSDWMNGSSFNGIYVEISSNGVVVGGGFTPVTYSGQVGAQYTVKVYYYPPYNWGNVFLDHMSTGSTTNSATMTLAGPTTVAAYYRTGHTLSISDVGSTGAVNGFYIQSVLDTSSNTILESGTYTPQSLSVPDGHSISVTLDDFGSLYVTGSNIGTFSRTTANGGGGTATFTVQGNTNLVFALSASSPTTTTTTTTTSSSSTSPTTTTSSTTTSTQTTTTQPTTTTTTNTTTAPTTTTSSTTSSTTTSTQSTTTSQPTTTTTTTTTAPTTTSSTTTSTQSTTSSQPTTTTTTTTTMTTTTVVQQTTTTTTTQTTTGTTTKSVTTTVTTTTTTTSTPATTTTTTTLTKPVTTTTTVVQTSTPTTSTSSSSTTSSSTSSAKSSTSAHSKTTSTSSTKTTRAHDPDVAPLEAPVSLPSYPVSIKVVDVFGQPIQGSSVVLTSANETQSTGVTNSSGLVTFGYVPSGGFNATYSYLGVSGEISGLASTGDVYTGAVALSYPIISLLAVPVGTIAILGIRRLRNRGSTYVQDPPF